MLLYSPDWLFLYPGLALMVLGCGVMAWLLPGPREFGRITIDVHTMLYAAAAVSLGFQGVAFARLTKTFCRAEGLLPDIRKAGRRIGLEGELLAGTGCVALGILGSIFALSNWGRRGFGPLDVEHSLRLVIPSVLAILLGVEVMLAGFFASVLELRTRRGGGYLLGRERKCGGYSRGSAASATSAGPEMWQI